ncbi:hypothetical protein [Noviherbaspirillum autotrophicum]|uniref:hypothetical protein n=1 Tax=Noviherbaspirillum autotrophicum TaxID=709839 RepID=UPI0012FE78EE|nr:hypothetical protein [Noviherbaspirillum autotrophicum]
MLCIIHDSAAKKKVPSHDRAKGADKSIALSEAGVKSPAKIRTSSTSYKLTSLQADDIQQHHACLSFLLLFSSLCRNKHTVLDF